AQQVVFVDGHCLRLRPALAFPTSPHCIHSFFHTVTMSILIWSSLAMQTISTRSPSHVLPVAVHRHWWQCNSHATTAHFLRIDKRSTLVNPSFLISRSAWGLNATVNP